LGSGDRNWAASQPMGDEMWNCLQRKRGVKNYRGWSVKGGNCMLHGFRSVIAPGKMAFLKRRMKFWDQKRPEKTFKNEGENNFRQGCVKRKDWNGLYTNFGGVSKALRYDKEGKKEKWKRSWKRQLSGGPNKGH
jgi:hypothetical protein